MNTYVYTKDLDLSKLHATDIIKFICENCYIEKTIQKRKFTEPLCKKCKLHKKHQEGAYKDMPKKIKETCLEKYGVKNYVQTKEFKERYKQIMQEKYGCNHFFQTKEFQKIRKETILKKYNSLEDFYKQVSQKFFKSFQEKYGKSWHDYVFSYFISKYGVSNPLKDLAIKEKFLKTNQNRYGGNSPMCSKEVLEKSYKTNLKKYGASRPAGNKNVLKKMQATCIERYGVENPMQNPEINKRARSRYFYNNLYFDSSWELAYYVWLKDQNIEFEYHPNIKLHFVFKGKDHYCLPDFLVNDELQEIKGGHFIENNTWINPYGEDDGLYEAKHQCLLKNNVKIISDCDKYLAYVSNFYSPSFFEETRL